MMSVSVVYILQGIIYCLCGLLVVAQVGVYDPDKEDPTACDDIPAIFHGRWFSSINPKRVVTIDPKTYLASGERIQEDPFVKVGLSTQPFEIHCLAPMRVMLKAVVGRASAVGSVQQCLTLVKLGKDVIEAESITQMIRVQDGEILDCRGGRQGGRDRRVFRFALTKKPLKVPKYSKVNCYQHPYVKNAMKLIEPMVQEFLTIDTCARTCAAFRQSYFLLYQGDTCLCFYSYIETLEYYHRPPYERFKPKKKEKAMCDKPCRGNKKQTCGGERAGMLYETHSPSNVNQDDMKIPGCFADNYLATNKYRLPFRPLQKWMAVSPGRCVQHCSKVNMMYAALTTGDTCDCANHYGRLAHDGECKSKCKYSEDKSLGRCGGDSYPFASVYRVIRHMQVPGCQSISKKFRGLWFSTTLPQRQIVIYEKALVYRTVTQQEDGRREFSEPVLMSTFQVVCIGTDVIRMRMIDPKSLSKSKIYHCMTMTMIEGKVKVIHTESKQDVLADCDLRESRTLKSYEEYALSRRPLPQDIRYSSIGCYYMDLGDTDLLYSMIYNQPAVEVLPCSRFCHAMGTNYFGIQNSRYCQCGYGVVEPEYDRDCLLDCGWSPHNKRTCNTKDLHHKVTAKVYKLDYDPDLQHIQAVKRAHLGCHVLLGATRDKCCLGNNLCKNLEPKDQICAVRMKYGEKMSASLCIFLCNRPKRLTRPGKTTHIPKYEFAYLINKMDCLCSSSHLQELKVSQEKCSFKCPGNPEQSCGGPNYFDVYDILKATREPSPDQIKVMSLPKHATESDDLKIILDRIFKGLSGKITWPANLPPKPLNYDSPTSAPGMAHVKDLASHLQDDVASSSQNDAVSLLQDDKSATQLDEVLIERGKNGQIPCTPDTKIVDPSFKWTKDDGSVSDSRFIQQADGSLSLMVAEPPDGGVYDCAITSGATGEVIHVKSNVTVYLVLRLRYKVRLVYLTPACSPAMALHKQRTIQDFLCQTKPCPYVDIQAHCHKRLDPVSGAMNNELWVSVTIEPADTFTPPTCEPFCMKKAIKQHLRMELSKVNELIESEEKQPNKLLSIKKESTSTKLVEGCPPGYLLVKNVCGPCPPGSFSPENSKRCEPCPVGHYQALYGTYKCYQCPAGKTTPDVGARSEDKCNGFGKPALWMLIAGALVPCVILITVGVTIAVRIKRRNAGDSYSVKKPIRKEKDNTAEEIRKASNDSTFSDDDKNPDQMEAWDW